VLLAEQDRDLGVRLLGRPRLVQDGEPFVPALAGLLLTALSPILGIALERLTASAVHEEHVDDADDPVPGLVISG
jgi:hypothetical protein